MWNVKLTSHLKLISRLVRVSILQPRYVFMASLVRALFVSILIAVGCTHWYNSLRDVLRA